MDVRGLLTEGFGRITELYDGVAEGLDDETLHHRPGGTGNPIGWLLWHLARVQDDHVADLADGRAGLGAVPGTVRPAQRHRRHRLRPHQRAGRRAPDRGRRAARGVPPRGDAATARYLETVDEAELEREVDQNWDPPVTAGQRLVSIQGDCLQHLGQAAYVKGLLDG